MPFLSDSLNVGVDIVIRLGSGLQEEMRMWECVQNEEWMESPGPGGGQSSWVKSHTQQEF